MKLARNSKQFRLRQVKRQLIILFFFVPFPPTHVSPSHWLSTTTSRYDRRQSPKVLAEHRACRPEMADKQQPNANETRTEGRPTCRTIPTRSVNADDDDDNVRTLNDAVAHVRHASCLYLVAMIAASNPTAPAVADDLRRALEKNYLDAAAKVASLRGRFDKNQEEYAGLVGEAEATDPQWEEATQSDTFKKIANKKKHVDKVHKELQAEEKRAATHLSVLRAHDPSFDPNKGQPSRPASPRYTPILPAHAHACTLTGGLRARHARL